MEKQSVISLSYCTRSYCAMATTGDSLIERIIEFLTRSKLRKAVKIQNGNLDRDMRVLDELVRLVHPEDTEDKRYG